MTEIFYSGQRSGKVYAQQVRIPLEKRIKELELALRDIATRDPAWIVRHPLRTQEIAKEALGD